jgi:hypothetical protein
MPANVLIVLQVKLDIALLLLDVQFSQLFEGVLFTFSGGFKVEPEMTGQGFPFVWICRFPCNVGKAFSSRAGNAASDVAVTPLIPAH